VKEGNEEKTKAFRMAILFSSCSSSISSTSSPSPQLSPPILSLSPVEVNSLTSEQTELPYDYYSLPFCRPPEGVKRSPGSTNPGTLLSGLRQENSPYNLSVKVERRTERACKDQPGALAQGFAPPLTEKQAELLAARISQRYRVRMILDNLAITTFDLEEGGKDDENSSVAVIPGYELGFLDQGSDGGSNSVQAFVNNHVQMKVLVHRVKARPGFLKGVGESSSSSEEEERKRNEALIDAVADLGVRRRLRRSILQQQLNEKNSEEDDTRFMIVGFEVLACSIRRDPAKPLSDVACVSDPGSKSMPAPQRVAVGESVSYTFDVVWEESNIKWASRWDA